MKAPRYRFKKFHMDKTWRGEFSEEALHFLKLNKRWLWEKINFALNEDANNSLDWIIIIDIQSVEKPGEGDNIFLSHSVVKTAQVASNNPSYPLFDNMLFKHIKLSVGAVANLQSLNDTVKEVAIGIVRGDGAMIDESIIYPFTKNVWKNPMKDPNKDDFL